MIFAFALPGEVRRRVTRFIHLAAPVFLLLLSGFAYAVDPIITGQNSVETPEETAREIVLTDLVIDDPDSINPDDFTLTVQDGSDYVRILNTITPNLDFNGDLTVPVVVNDGTADSNTFDLTVAVTPLNDAPAITGQNAINIAEEAEREIVLGDLIVDDPDNTFPGDFTLTVQDGTDYTRVGNTITPGDQFSGNLTVPVLVNDGTNDSNTFNLTVSVAAVNDAPVITGQLLLSTPEDTPLLIALTDLTVDDPDNIFPDDFTLSIQDSLEYTFVDTIITPALDFEGPLTVAVTVNDGVDDSEVFNLLITVTPVNDVPVFIDLVQPLSTPEDTSRTIVLADLIVSDPDNVVPDEITLTLLAGTDYTLAGDGTTITPAENFNGQLIIGATISDLEATSAPFSIVINVDPVNDLPVLVAPIGNQNAVERDPFNLDISGNFSDADGETLSYTASWSPQKPPNINFNTQSGVFSGTPQLVDAEAPGPVYRVTVTARDLIGELVSDSFDLTIAALGRANLSLTIDVSSTTAMPNEDLLWTFTSVNPVGPVAGVNVELRGSFLGVGITVAAEAGANCPITPVPNANRVDFVCILGTLPVAQLIAITFTTTTSQATEIIAFATTQGAQEIPIDPNLDDNSAIESAGVADSFSVGAVQILGTAGVRSIASGDVNNDGIEDLVVGTVAGQPVQIYLGAIPRESCQCQRDFLPNPLSIPDTGSNEGVALADFDNNGSLDLVIANGGGQADRVYSNDGAGNFTLVATLELSNANDVAVGDFNSDGNMDIAIAASSPNLVYFGNGGGGFGNPRRLGNADSRAVAVGAFNGAVLNDLVFANVGSDSRVWVNTGGTGFSSRDLLPIGDAVAVAAADLDNDGDFDLVFGRVPTVAGEIPSNPVMINPGNGNFGAPSALLGISPTNDVLIGDVNGGLPDLVFINASGVHQIWTNNGGTYALHVEQIIDIGAVTGVLSELGDTDNGEPGGFDLAMGGDAGAGVSVYLNDSAGSLGRGDLVPPVITLTGMASVTIDAKSTYVDSGATAVDNIDGALAPIATSTVNTAVLGNYTVTYSVNDFAGNAATPVVRNVTVKAGTGRGGGGGGTIGFWTLIMLVGVHLLILMRARVRFQMALIKNEQ